MIRQLYKFFLHYCCIVIKFCILKFNQYPQFSSQMMIFVFQKKCVIDKKIKIARSEKTFSYYSILTRGNNKQSPFSLLTSDFCVYRQKDQNVGRDGFPEFKKTPA